jgi:uncharacterized membrane protein/uncharacterized membrane protein YeaQ/YmgE (transglycosylase-associated protein family)
MTQALIGLATGLMVGWLVRTAMKSRRDYGLVGDLITGSLGAAIGGWLVRSLDIVTPDNWWGHLFVSVTGAATLIASLRVIRGTLQAGLPTDSPARTVAGELDEQIKRLTALERRVLSSVLSRSTANPALEPQASFGDRIADRVAKFGGSWMFIGIFLTAMLVWMRINRDITHPFDPYPYILLNLVLSCVAALQAPIIMMSQNRQSARDRTDAQLDYEVNLRAEMQIVGLHAKLDEARDQDLKSVAVALAEQEQRLRRIEQALSER